MRIFGAVSLVVLIGIAANVCHAGDSESIESQIDSLIAKLDKPADNAVQNVRYVSEQPTESKKTSWLETGDLLAKKMEAADLPQPQQDETLPYVPWKQRRGRAYPGDFWHSFGRDAKEFIPMMWDDTKAVACNKVSLAGLALAGISGLLLIDQKPDHRIEDHYQKHGRSLSKFWDNFGDVAGAPQLHFGIAGGMYILSHFTEDDKTYEVSKTLLSGLAITGLTTVALKAAVRTESPNGDEYGWPSGHTSSSFCFATIMYHEYGPWVGVPLFALASFVGFERIDAQNHDFSDVVAGALIGMAIGHAVAQNHEAKVFGMDVIPFADPERNAFGIALAKQW